MKDSMWISLQTIKEAYPKYVGEWPISHYCYKRKEKLKNTELFITDRHGSDTWDFHVSDCEKQAEWYSGYKYVEKVLSKLVREAR